MLKNKKVIYIAIGCIVIGLLAFMIWGSNNTSSKDIDLEDLNVNINAEVTSQRWQYSFYDSSEALLAEVNKSQLFNLAGKQAVSMALDTDELFDYAILEYTLPIQDNDEIKVAFVLELDQNTPYQSISSVINASVYNANTTHYGVLSYELKDEQNVEFNIDFKLYTEGLTETIYGKTIHTGGNSEIVWNPVVDQEIDYIVHLSGEGKIYIEK